MQDPDSIPKEITLDIPEPPAAGNGGLDLFEVLDDEPDAKTVEPSKLLSYPLLVHLDSLAVYPAAGGGPGGGSHSYRFDWARGRVDGADGPPPGGATADNSVFLRLGAAGRHGSRHDELDVHATPPSSAVVAATGVPLPANGVAAAMGEPVHPNVAPLMAIPNGAAPALDLSVGDTGPVAPLLPAVPLEVGASSSVGLRRVENELACCSEILQPTVASLGKRPGATVASFPMQLHTCLVLEESRRAMQDVWLTEDAPPPMLHVAQMGPRLSVDEVAPGPSLVIGLPPLADVGPPVRTSPPWAGPDEPSI